MNYYKILKHLIYCFPPETAHNIAISALKNGIVPKQKSNSNQSLKQNIFGINFENPVGLAAGFDKNAESIESLSSQGFGFIEVGTVTPKQQDGNPKPRLFRLSEDEAIINRMGFNNKGADYFAKNLRNRKSRAIIGANIGKNKLSEDAVEDYITLIRRLYGLSDYITVNISSPNTPGLRGLQNKDELDKLVKAILNEREQVIKEKNSKKIPILVKIAPDNSHEQYEDIANLALNHKIDGLIVSNTTISRENSLKSKHKNESGGLSGKPLFDLSTQALSDIYRLTKGQIPIVGVGGISTPEKAYAKIKSGASLVQIYSSLIFHGFSLVNEINQGLEKLLEKDGFNNIKEAIGADSS